MIIIKMSKSTEANENKNLPAEQPTFGIRKDKK